MLSKRILRKTLGIKDHAVENIIWDDDNIEIYLDRHRQRLLPCGICRTRSRVRDRLKARRWTHVPLWGIAVTLVYEPARVKCPKCGKIKVEQIPWAQGKSPLTKGLIWLLSAWSKLLPWKTVAGLFGVHWNTVAGAVRQAVSYGLRYRRLGTILFIGIDELSRRRGHVYVTNVYDLAKGRLIWSGEGRSQETLEAFFKEHGKPLKKVVGICSDMWQPYIEMITSYLPEATLVFDKFHIIRHLLDAVDQVRRQEAQRLKKTHPELLKGTRYIWLKNPENLTDKQQSRLSYLEQLNLRIHRAYLLKEAFRRLWDYSSKGWARRYLQKWFWWATHSRLAPIRDFAWMVRNHQEQILNYFKLPITNGKVEGLNNKAKVVSHRCYGFRKASTFITALYHCLGDLAEPQLAHSFM